MGTILSNVAAVHRGFMHSSHHRENLLNPEYNLAGFAVVRNGNMIYVTENLENLPRITRVETS
jgi:uncharacterized protein YkwD